VIDLHWLGHDTSLDAHGVLALDARCIVGKGGDESGISVALGRDILSDCVLEEGSGEVGGDDGDEKYAGPEN